MTTTYYGAICCEFDKSVERIQGNYPYKPKVETAGMSTICRWYESFQEREDFISYAVETLKYHIITD